VDPVAIVARGRLNRLTVATNPVHAVLVAHGTRTLCHYTLVENLPGILREGAIFSRAELKRRGIACNSSHYFGSPEKEEILSGYVSCATMPPWGMMGHETEELAIIDLDPVVVATPGTCFCPGWSPKAHFSAQDIITWVEPEHAEALYSGSGYQTVAGAEIFIPTAIHMRHIRAIAFYDREGSERALPELRKALAETEATDTSDQTITVAVEPTRFPRDWAAEGPPWTRGEGEDDQPIF
jgi:hypothetical protein